MKYKLTWMVFSLFCWAGCYEEDPLTPTVGGEFKYSVPQGNHEYDNRIVEWNRRGDFYILYKFDPKDIYFNMSQWNESLFDSLQGSMESQKIVGVMADEKYVGKQLDLIEETFLNFYPDTALLCWMPAKLLLCSELRFYGWGGSYSNPNMYDGFDNIAFNYGSEKIETILADKDSKIKFKTDVNKILFERIFDREKIGVPKDFAGVSKYGGKVEDAEKYALGFIESAWNGVTPLEDMHQYVEAIITYSYDELNAETTKKYYPALGMLNPNQDVNGLIRKKYDYIISYFRNTWGIDLQAIGNYQKQ